MADITSTTAETRSRHAAIGEYLVLGELLKRNVEAYLAQGPVQKGWDIWVRIGKRKCRTIQVKAVNWPHRMAVQIQPNRCFDVLAVVLLDKENERSRFLLFAESEIDMHLSPHSDSRKDGKRTINISRKAMEKNGKFKCYEDRWDVVTDMR